MVLFLFDRVLVAAERREAALGSPWFQERTAPIPGTPYFLQSGIEYGVPNGTKLSIIDRFRVAARPSFDGKSQCFRW
jgi:hypothetical protein